MTHADIRQALSEERYESARRMCLTTLDQAPPEPQETLLLLHSALRALGDIPAARAALGKLEPRDGGERLEVGLRVAEDLHRLSGHDFFRKSVESDQGLCYDEYELKYQTLSAAAFDEALPLADTPARQAQAAVVLRRCKRGKQADALAPAPKAVVPTAPDTDATGTLCGRLSFPDGSAAAGATVTVGFPQAISWARPERHLAGGCGGDMQPTFHGEQRSRSTTTDAQGRYRFEALPALCYEFVSVNLDPLAYDLALRFFGRDVKVKANGETVLDAVLADWQSAGPAAMSVQPVAGGLASYELRNPFYFDFPRQFVRLPMPAGAAAAQLVVVSSDAPGEEKPTQALSDGTLGCFLDLPARSDRVVTVRASQAATATATPSATSASLTLREDADGGSLVLDTGRVRFRLPSDGGAPTLPPILAVKGFDDRWRGQGRLVLPAGVTVAARRTELLESGSLQLRVACTYTLSTGDTLRFELTAHQGEAYLLVRETSAPLEGVAFQFSLREFHGGRGFLHWTPEHGNVHWTTLDDEARELGRLQESVAWWIPPQGFGYAMSPDGLAETDYIGVFTRRRGEWIDREFERLAQGPPADNRELDWPYPEMVGSTISMITAHTDATGDAYFHFGAFDGERQWGLLVSTLAENDGPYKTISAVQHKVSSPRLEEFMTWRLHEADHEERPFLIASRHELRDLRRKKDSPEFAPVWELMVNGQTRGPSRGLRAIVEADPVLTWHLACEMRIKAPLRARLTLLGRDYSDVYSPVGGRDITPFAEQYDLIAATGCFTAVEERDIRASLLLMGHMFMQEDFMNWRFNSRNANFEADRTDIVGTVGLTFRGNPDADAMVRHATELMEKSLNVYCTPGSGKWYENPACYYLHAASCRINLAFHLYQHGIMDVTAIPRLRDFMHWGPILLTAPFPHDYATLRDGCSYAEYEAIEKVRRVPPIGDHAKLGQWVGEIFALMGKAYRHRDPAFADFLKWAYQAGGSNGGHFSALPLYFKAVEASDLEPAPAVTLPSRRLESFGAVFRGNFGLPDEFYLLFKQGPGGYRYHRTEGSFLLMAQGRPLVWDGGEAGETWRHSTLSFHDTHMPLAPGHVEQFRTLPSLDFVQGVHPKALDPGDPVFLSDKCEHQLEQVAYDRFNEPNPADARSILWIKDEYVVVFDDLRLAAEVQTHWHLQVVSDAHTGNPADGYRFTGRYGVDLQVLLPDFPAAVVEKVEQVPTLEYRMAPEDCFAMRHLQLSMATAPARLAAVLRPLAPGQQPLTATAFPGGITVTGDGIHDTLFLGREVQEFAGVAGDGDGGELRFRGRYAAVLRRPGGTTLVLLDGERLALGDRALTVPGEG